MTAAAASVVPSMAREVYVGSKRIRLDPKRMLGKGGEADVFALDRGRVLKVFKSPDHPDYDGRPEEQRAAAARIREHQAKLRCFPSNLPPAVIVPQELATDRSGQHVFGYAMQAVTPAEPLLRYGDSHFRRAGIPSSVVIELFRELHGVVSGLHAAGVTIGDFNDLNVLVTTDHHRPHVIDADSFQFDRFACTVFTERFVDPLHCDPSALAPRLVRPYEPNADWYAFSLLLMQSLLFVGPYGGIYRPKLASDRIPTSARPLRRITVFHPDVQYPKPAMPYCVLPDDLLQHFHDVFEKDLREPFPVRVLDACRFVACPHCGTEHARSSCPSCSPAAGAPARNAVAARGEVTCHRCFETPGTLLYACVQDGELRFVYHENGQYRREDGSVAISGPLDPRLRWRITGRTTLVGRGGEVAELSSSGFSERFPVDSDVSGPAFDTCGTHRYWASSGLLYRQTTPRQTAPWQTTPPGGPLPSPAQPAPTGSVQPGGPGCAASGWSAKPSGAGSVWPAAEPIGEVLSGQTRIWAGPQFGLGLYRASNLTVAFLFDAERRGINDSLPVPDFRGHLVDAAAVLDANRAWLLASLHDGGRTRHRCWVYSRHGGLEAHAEAEPGDGSWLGTLGGQCAVNGMLFAPTDAGICRVELQRGTLQTTRLFSDTEPFVDASHRLLVGKDGLYVVGPRAITILRFR